MMSDENGKLGRSDYYNRSLHWENRIGEATRAKKQVEIRNDPTRVKGQDRLYRT